MFSVTCVDKAYVIEYIASIIGINYISSIICERIEQYNREVEIVNTSIVLQVGDGVACSYGLDEVMAGELAEFEEGTIGIGLELNNVGVVSINDGSMMGSSV